MTQPILLLKHPITQMRSNAASVLLGARLAQSSHAAQGLIKFGSTAAVRRVHSKTTRSWPWLLHHRGPAWKRQQLAWGGCGKTTITRRDQWTTQGI
ncbi:hypothetical protein EPUL_001360, partial [Erysiphe pulchra]